MVSPLLGLVVLRTLRAIGAPAHGRIATYLVLFAPSALAPLLLGRRRVRLQLHIHRLQHHQRRSSSAQTHALRNNAPHSNRMPVVLSAISAVPTDPPKSSSLAINFESHGSGG